MDFDYYQFEKPAGIQEIRPDEYDATERLLADSKTPSPPVKGKTEMQVTDQGQIAKMDLPPDWKKLPDRDQPFTLQSGVDFQLPQKGELAIFERGQRVSEQAGGAFRKALNSPVAGGSDARALDVSGKDGELTGLNAILNDLGNSNKFKIDEATIRTINGKRVLEITGQRGYRDDDGHWTDSGVRVSNIYIDKFGTGDAIQEIRLAAPEASFKELRNNLNQALTTIEWKR